MRLRQVQVVGFKSFAKPVRFLFDEPISAVVGPNGSGKSNFVEAVRFVLGEQSNKSLRSGQFSDLLFRGEGQSGATTQATVTIAFDNTDRVFRLVTEANTELSLDFDEITISRTLRADGTSLYAINGTPVRLKDIQQLLAGVGIGTSGHHIISQGQADRIVTASPKERRAMIEDALGLKVYQYRLREAERKLAKAVENMQITQQKELELRPELQRLEREVAKIARARSIRQELQGLYLSYLAQEYQAIEAKKISLQQTREQLVKASQDYRQQKNQLIADLRQTDPTEDEAERQLSRDIEALQSKLQESSHQRGQLEGKLEGIRASLSALSSSRPDDAKEPRSKQVSAEAVRELTDDMIALARELADESSLARLHAGMRRLEDQVRAFWGSQAGRAKQLPTDNGLTILLQLSNEMGRLEEAIAKSSRAERLLEHQRNLKLHELSVVRESTKKARERQRLVEQELASVEAEVKHLSDRLVWHEDQAKRVATRERRFAEEVAEAGVLLGQVAYRYDQIEPSQLEQLDDDGREVLRRRVERLKLQLEQVGGGGGREVEEAYQELKERHQYLVSELDDIASSRQSLLSLMADLEATVRRKFRAGVNEIGTTFHEFFSAMFGGGRAELAVLSQEGEDETDDDYGIAIKVKLPNKQVTAIDMLSGGERSLTAIALLFALSRVNPPPFLILDETDAALDEANSRRYGDMLEALAQHAQLVVVTHNRETMSRAQNLYGVTLDRAGSSQLLSIKLEDAIRTAAR